MKVGVLGGTFDPPHIGHLIAAEEVRTQLALERVWFLPTGTPPHKLDEQITEATQRVEMVQRAVAPNPHFFVSRIDVERSGPSYTVETLRMLHEQWGDDTEIHFIVGMDMLADLPNWREPQQVIELCRLAVVDRPAYEANTAELEAVIPGLAAKIDQVDMPLLEISSTDLRRRIRHGRTARYYVPNSVEAYIRTHNLYV